VSDVKLSYYMGQTTITISGTVTFHYDNLGFPTHFDRTAFVSTGVGADTEQPYQLVLRRKKLFRGDNEIDLSLAPDGRLLGAGVVASGGGADVAAGVVAVLTLSATLATAIPTAAAALVQKKVNPTKEQDQAPGTVDPGDGSENWHELSDRAKTARTRVRDLQSRVFELAKQAAGDDPPAGLADQIKTVSTSLDLARAEVANLQQALKAWQSKHYPDRSASFTYRFNLDDLGTVDGPPDNYRQSPSKLSGAACDAACTLHTIVLRVVGHGAAADRPASNSRGTAADPPAPNKYEIHYRVPYSARLAIYELAETPDVDPAKAIDQIFNWRLRQIVPIWALGKESDVTTVNVVPTHFGRGSLQVDFGDSGAVSHISVADVGPIANLSNALSGAVQASSSGSGSPPPAAGGAAPPAAAPAGSGASQDPVLAPLQMEAAVKKVQADIAGYDKTIRDDRADAQPPKQGGSK
jgi:hypothetical protein